MLGAGGLKCAAAETEIGHGISIKKNTKEEKITWTVPLKITGRKIGTQY